MFGQRLSPLIGFGDLRREMGRMLDSVVHPFNVLEIEHADSFPPINVWEDERHYFVEAELPGVELKDVSVEVAGDELTLSGSRQHEENKDWTFHRRERGTGTFSRTVTFPAQADASKVEATLRNGVLTVRLAKSPEAVARKIAIKSE